MAARALGGAYRAQLGECPVWDARGKHLFFIDVIAPSVSRLSVATGELRTWRLPNWCALHGAVRNTGN